MKFIDALITYWMLKALWETIAQLFSIIVGLLALIGSILQQAVYHLTMAFHSLWRCAFPRKSPRPAAPRPQPRPVNKTPERPIERKTHPVLRVFKRLLCFLGLMKRSRTVFLNGHRVQILERAEAPGYEIRMEKGFEHLTANAISYLKNEGILESLTAKTMSWD
jgi:hypothetical protein